MGEGFGRWQLGDSQDADLIPFISSANIAAGFHAGDASIIHKTVELAGRHNVAIGIHPGYNDKQGFGRRKILATNDELIDDIIYQIGAVSEFARFHGYKISHIKPHGALFMELASNEELSRKLLEYLGSFTPQIPILCMGISKTYHLATLMKIPTIREFYADRDYDDNGSIVFARDVGRPDPKAIAEKVLRACLQGKVTTIHGNDIDIDFESICFHSDTLGARDIAFEIYNLLSAHNIKIQSFHKC